MPALSGGIKLCLWVSPISHVSSYLVIAHLIRLHYIISSLFLCVGVIFLSHSHLSLSLSHIHLYATHSFFNHCYCYVEDRWKDREGKKLKVGIERTWHASVKKWESGNIITDLSSLRDVHASVHVVIYWSCIYINISLT